jgi:hypothetical protein
MAPCTRWRLLPDPIVKQPSVFVLAAENRASREFYFRWLPQKREQSAAWRTRDACSLESRRPALRSAGLALRRSTAASSNLGAPLPFGPDLAAFAGREGVRTKPWASVLRREAVSKDSRDRGCEPRPQAPLPVHTQHACRASLRRTGMRTVYSNSKYMSISKLYRCCHRGRSSC